MGHIFAFMTADRAGLESESEEYGWIDPKWSRTELFDSRNDVTPLVDCDENDPDLADYVREALETLGAYDDNGDGSFYGQSVAGHEGAFWRYALHFTCKFHGDDGWKERPWHPVNDGHIVL